MGASMNNERHNTNPMKEMKTTLIVITGILLFVCLSCSQKKSPTVNDGLIRIKDGIDLYFQRIGEGPEAIIIPSGMYLSHEFKRLASENRTLIFYDQRGRGRSQSISDKSKLGIDFELSDLESIRSHFGFEKISLIGWSYSGAVVVLYTVEHPNFVKRIIQIGPIPPRKDPYFYQFISRLSSRRDSSEQALLVNTYATFQETGNLEEYIRDYYEIAHKALKYDKEKEEHFRSDFFTLENERPDKVWGVVLPTIIESFENWDFREELVNIKHPVLTVHGDYDAIPLESAREWSSSLSNNRLLVVQNAGHLPWFEKSSIVFNALDTFLDGEWPEMTENRE